VRTKSTEAALAELTRRGIPIFAGGDDGDVATAERVNYREGFAIRAGVPNYPLGPPSVAADGTITVPNMLSQPTRITRMVMDMSLQKFLLDVLFTSGGGVTGGAVVYDVPTVNELYTDRDVQRVEPGAEFPILTSVILKPSVAEVEKWGGKVFITDEARDRNDTVYFTKQVRQMTNTMIRKLNQRGIEVVEAIFGTYPGQVIGGNNWSIVTTQGTSPTPYAQQAVGDFVKIQLHNEQLELGIEHDTLIMNPQERASLQLAYGENWQSVLSEYGYSNVFVSNRVNVGVAYSLTSGDLGQMRIEKPLGTETWREPNTERTWLQTSVRPLFFVDNPYSVVKLTGLHG